MVLIGAGAIGTFVLAGLLHLNDVDVTVIDFAGARLDRTLRLGASKAIAVDDPDFEAQVAELARSADVVIEASGANGQLRRALGMVRDGGVLLQVGLPTTEQELDVHTLVFREIAIETTLAHCCAEDMPDAISILHRTSLADELLEGVFPLDQLAEQLDRLATGQIGGKVLFDPTRVGAVEGVVAAVD